MSGMFFANTVSSTEGRRGYEIKIYWIYHTLFLLIWLGSCISMYSFPLHLVAFFLDRLLYLCDAVRSKPKKSAMLGLSDDRLVNTDLDFSSSLGIR